MSILVQVSSKLQGVLSFIISSSGPGVFKAVPKYPNGLSKGVYEGIKNYLKNKIKSGLSIAISFSLLLGYTRLKVGSRRLMLRRKHYIDLKVNLGVVGSKTLKNY